MPRIPLPELASHSPEVRKAIGERPANVSLLMAAASEPVYRGLGQLGSALIQGSALPPKLRELAILRVGYISGSAYEVFQHEALARHIGMSEAQIDAIRAGQGASQLLLRTHAVGLTLGGGRKVRSRKVFLIGGTL